MSQEPMTRLEAIEKRRLTVEGCPVTSDEVEFLLKEAHRAERLEKAIKWAFQVDLFDHLDCVEDEEGLEMVEILYQAKDSIPGDHP